MQRLGLDRRNRDKNTRENSIESVQRLELKLQQYNEDNGRGLDLVEYVIWKSETKSVT